MREPLQIDNHDHFPSLQTDDSRSILTNNDNTMDGSMDQTASQEWEDPNATLVLEAGRPLEDELWFHGVLPRGEVVRLLVINI